ncbi:uncharacterized protein FTOL_03888 [Fusarium torulosum]|uniref:Ankyrin repeat protein n=1 Tax=Fusarium torulosum TaxID=33205 RepID=A0AAE8SFQ1_9HYPO|nr:uncharacterized protein FTOL_03888 [Fusarium torulosum]
MEADGGTTTRSPPVMGEPPVDESDPKPPVDGGSYHSSSEDSPVSVFDILNKMAESENPNTDELRNILENNKSIIEAKDSDGLMPLHAAVNYGLLEATEVLLEFQADATAQDDEKRQPLHIACRQGNKDIAKLLLDKGANIEARWNGITPFHAACWSGKIDIVKFLIDEGAKILVTDNIEWTPLLTASVSGYEEIAKALLEKDKRNINHTEKVGGWTALHLAMHCGHESIVSMLMGYGANPDLQDGKGYTALHIAISENYPELVNQLLDKGAGTKIKDNDDWTTLHFVARYSDKEIATKVLIKGARDVINVKDKHGWTALHVASSQGNESVVKALLGDKEIRSKLEINVKNNDDNTALHLASGALDGGVDQYKPDDDSESSSEEKAIRQGVIIDELLGAEADSKIKNKNEKSSIDLIMADDEPYRFRGLLAYVSHPYLPPEIPLTEVDMKKTEVNGLLAMEEFFTLLTKLIHQSSPGMAINTTLRSTLYMLLDVLGNDVNIPLLKHFPSALGLLISASSPNDHLNARLKSAAVSITNILKQLRPQHSKKKPQKGQQTSIAMFNRQNKGNLQDKGKEVDKMDHGIPVENLTRKVPEALLNSLDDIGDILRDPQFSQLHRDDYSKFIMPNAKKGLESVLEGFEAVVVQFYKEKGKSGSLLRYRSVNEVIYGAGPTTIMKARSHYTNFEFKHGPKFSWVHLPSTNMVWMQEADKHHAIDAIEDKDTIPEQYFALRSFFRDSWIQVPDGDTPSRVMQPRALGQNRSSSAQDNRERGQDTDLVEPGGRGPKQEADVPQDNHDKNQNTDVVEHKAPRPERVANTPQASAAYMPYFCFSTCHNEARDNLKDPEKLRAYQALLNGYQDSVIHESPTLDEWYYHFAMDNKSAEDRSLRNREQVVTKFLKEQEKTKEDESRMPAAGNTDAVGHVSERVEAVESSSDDHWILLRVNQIWIWTFADKWIITASSCSLDDNHETLVEGILGQLQKQVEYGGSESQPGTTEAMKKLIVDYCVASYERKPARKPKMSIGQIFSNYMNRIGRDETVLFQRLSHRATSDVELPKETADLGSSINSHPDGVHHRGQVKTWEEKMRKSIKLAEDLFADIKDVRDELNILKSVARFQKKVQLDLAGKSVKDTNLSADYVENDIKEMDNVADRIQSALNATLSLQQSEIANEQADAANRLAEDAYKQTQYARQQNTVLMTFTTATIVFLPLSFLSSLFALDAEAFSKTPSWVFLVIFLVSLGVSVIILALGFVVYRFAPITEDQAQVPSSSGAKGKKKSPIAKARSGDTAKTTQVNGKGRVGGHLLYRHGRTKLGDQELGNMTRSEGN